MSAPTREQVVQWAEESGIGRLNRLTISYAWFVAGLEKVAALAYAAGADSLRSELETKDICSDGLLERINELEKEALWVRRKLDLPDDVKLLSGSQTLAGTLHNVVAHANGYVKYIETGKCDDKAGEIARLSTQLAKLEQQNLALLPAIEQAQSVIDGKSFDRSLVYSTSTELLEARDRKRDAALLRLIGKMLLGHEIYADALCNLGMLARSRESGEWKPEL